MVALTTDSTAPARQLDAQQRQNLAVAVLAGSCVTDLARRNEVSRKFIYRQKECRSANRRAFCHLTERRRRRSLQAAIPTHCQLYTIVYPASCTA